VDSVILAIELLRRIPPNRRITSRELWEQLKHAGHHRSLRSIQRQMNALSDYFGVEQDTSSKPYGYRWKQNARGLAIARLTAAESLLLMLARKHLNGLLPAPLMKSLDGFFQQAQANLGPSEPSPEREWLEKVRVVSATPPLIPPRIDQEIFEAVSEALFRNQWLLAEYKNAAGKQSSIEVMPLGLAQQGTRLYLVCRYADFNNERSLAMHRIISARVSPRKFQRPTDFDLVRYDNDGRFGFGEGKRVHLHFRIEKDAGFHLTESKLSDDQQVQEFEDCYEIEATVVDSAQLHWWLRSFGDSVWDVKTDAVPEDHADDTELRAPA
jgi:predicted DNA-binding transcriptional regulator YafY